LFPAFKDVESDPLFSRGQGSKGGEKDPHMTIVTKIFFDGHEDLRALEEPGQLVSNRAVDPGDRRWREVLDSYYATVRGEPGDWVFLLRATRAGAKTVRAEGQDSGTGINEGDMATICQTFYATRPDGIGIGPAIPRSIVDIRGGPDGGPTYTFTLPIASDWP
jgi:hypothetical protein